MKNGNLRTIGILFTILFVSFILAVVFTSCNPSVDQPKKPVSKILEQNSENYDRNYRVYELEGCEYIVVGVGNMRWGSHKGNCKNPIHNKEEHFDCTVEDKTKSESGYEYTTECGLTFQSKENLQVGERLTGVRSPKHN
jgi:hypothetical protein